MGQGTRNSQEMDQGTRITQEGWECQEKQRRKSICQKWEVNLSRTHPREKKLRQNMQNPLDKAFQKRIRKVEK